MNAELLELDAHPPVAGGATLAEFTADCTDTLNDPGASLDEYRDRLAAAIDVMTALHRKAVES